MIILEVIAVFITNALDLQKEDDSRLEHLEGPFVLSGVRTLLVS